MQRFGYRFCDASRVDALLARVLAEADAIHANPAGEPGLGAEWGAAPAVRALHGAAQGAQPRTCCSPPAWPQAPRR